MSEGVTSRRTEHTRGFVFAPVDALRYDGQTADPIESPGILLRHIPTGSDVLDVGCGTGAISALVRDVRSCRVTGIEPNEARAEIASQRGIRVLNRPFDSSVTEELPAFDVVMFADVLEHLVDPAGALLLAREFLKPGGYVVASVPNIAHWSVRLALLRGRFNYETSGIMDATHLRWFTRKTVHSLFASAGYRIEALDGAAGLWMAQYQGRVFRRLSPAFRRRVVSAAVARWPGLFSCQHVVRATPVQPVTA